ncbi:MAG TPA: amidohydrolase family protein [Chitinophagaceae bacterium]|nr:amidohydrolase family protein [Chitinophagaceae bacterium]
MHIAYFYTAMRKYTAIIWCLVFAISASAQTDSGTLLLHKFAKNIGKETYHITRTDSGDHYKIDFKFVDRGAPVPLQASIFVDRNAEAKKLWLKGNTSRFSTIHDSIVINGQTAYLKIDDSTYTKNITAPAFLVAGYSPGTVQMLLLQYWEKHGHPQEINVLPSGSLRIKKDGTDAVTVNNKTITLQRYIISGLIWGNEIVWTDEQGKLICLITNDAEGDKLEMMAEPYESLLPQLIAKAAQYSMQLFTESVSNKNSPALTNFAIVGGNVLNVEDGTWIKDAVLLIRNGKIVQMGSKDEVSLPSNISKVDAEGKTILPGLWDMHAHFQQAEWGPAYLGAGVTTVRDVGNEFEYINAIQESINSGKGVGPHILKAGIIDGVGPFALGVINANTVDEAKRMVNMYKKNGFVQIKIYSSAKPAIVKAICDEAHRLGLPVTGHIPDGMTLLQGIDSGMDMVNHMQYVYSVLKKTSNGSIDWNDSANRIISKLVKSGMVVDPTIGVYELVFHPLDDDITLIEPAFSTLPAPLQSLFEHMGMPAERAKNYKAMFEAMRSLVKVLHDKGVRIVAGTDMGFPGLSLHRELELYVDAGLTPLEAIQTATIVPAKVMGMYNEFGSVDKGKVADLVIVDGDVLENIRNVRKVEWVVKDGKLYDPVGLKVMAGFGVRK